FQSQVHNPPCFVPIRFLWSGVRFQPTGYRKRWRPRRRSVSPATWGTRLSAPIRNWSSTGTGPRTLALVDGGGMKWWFGFALAALPLCGAPGTELAPITLYTQFAEQPPVAVFDAMQNEVRSIMAPMGLRFHWMDLAESTGKQVS